ncbi:hypothetical protein OQA88_13463 [Cercophora sp. LCS_1]
MPLLGVFPRQSAPGPAPTGRPPSLGPLPEAPILNQRSVLLALTIPFIAIYIGTATYPLSFMLIKIALLLQYLRAFNGPRTRQVCKWMIVISTVSGVVFSVCTWFSCWPVQFFWDNRIDGQCWGFASRNHLEFMRITVTQVVIAVVLDLAVFVIPFWIFFSENKPEQRLSKVSLFGLLVLALGVLFCSFWRMVYVVKLNDHNGFDPLFDNPTVMGLASYEVHLAAICAAIPVFWPVVKETWNRIFVTYEVTVTRGYQEFPSKKQTDIELLGKQSEGWEPFVGDETSGLGESETTVQSLAGKRPRKPRDILGHENGSDDRIIPSRG